MSRIRVSLPGQASKKAIAPVQRVAKQPPVPQNPYGLRLYDNTMLGDFKRCPRQFYYRHVLGWVPSVPSSALIFGSGWHNAMDFVWDSVCRKKVKTKAAAVDGAVRAFTEKWEEEDGPSTLANFEPGDYAPFRTPETAHEMLIHYVDERWEFMTSREWELIDVERPFAVPVNPEDASLFYVGRLDKVGRLNRALTIIEHKTTSLYAKNGPFQSRFVDSFSPNSQIDGYIFSGSALYGTPVKTVLVDGALVHRLVHDGFRFIPIEKQFAQIEGWLWEVLYWIKSVEANRRAATGQEMNFKGAPMHAFPRNTNSCTDFSGCPYLDVCRVTANPAQRALPPGFSERFWSPFDQWHLERIYKKGKLEAINTAKGGK